VQQSALSSALPNDAFTSMSHFTATSPSSGSFIQLMVLGFARIAGAGSLGSVVQLLTVAGTVTIDGRTQRIEIAEMTGWNGAWYVTKLR
jgi:hypothetical protein